MKAAPNTAKIDGIAAKQNFFFVIYSGSGGSAFSGIDAAIVVSLIVILLLSVKIHYFFNRSSEILCNVWNGFLILNKRVINHSLSVG